MEILPTRCWRIIIQDMDSCICVCISLCKHGRGRCCLEGWNRNKTKRLCVPMSPKLAFSLLIYIKYIYMCIRIYVEVCLCA
ncbi:hypothetical protein BDV37DRAFT_250138 [Aspergillus pseudonomiae]|uniref:Uncharacterized protein n=1 Tax=Aspergillus pseudonomiae TaxID=1506151 RepID=A0A5N7DAJ9_9EURO|nr:uncharacterized protein BDV37DRAFT_250138 [Aspergillus pseudonomiae]KAE8403472.1 hypothetical protein BDV37DRAFT_250138 [Aspergillus pseudonomiae]